MPLNFKLYRQYGALNSQPVFDAFEHGLKYLGFNLVNSNEDVSVIWSVLWNGRMVQNQQIYHRCIQDNRPIIVLEVGGIQRGITWKVGINGINRGSFSLDNLDPDRVNKLKLSLKPWQTNDGDILICGQHERSHQWKGMPKMNNWVLDTINCIRQYTDRKIVVRPHPRSPIILSANNFKNVVRQQPIKKLDTYDDYDLKFKDIHSVINWSSNPGIQAVLNGIPAFVGPPSLAYTVANSDLTNIETPATPDRQQWLVEYAHTEWTLDEIIKGIPLLRLLPKIKDYNS